jgi:hypothetical protein
VVDVPNSDTTLLFQHYQVDQIVTGSTVIPEVIQYTISRTSATSAGSVTLSLYQYDASGKQYAKSVTVAYGITSQQFTAALNSFDIFSNKGVSTTSSI